MEVFDAALRRRGQDCAGEELYALIDMPAVPETCEGEHLIAHIFTIFENEMRLLHLFPIWHFNPLPFIPTRCRDERAASFEGRAKARLLGRRFDPRIKQRPSLRRLFTPRRMQAPAHRHNSTVFLPIKGNDRNHRAGRNIIARLPLPEPFIR